MNTANESQERRLPPSAQWAAVLFVLVFPSAYTWVYFIALAGDRAGAQHAAYTAGKIIQFLFPVVWIAIVERRRLRFQPPTMRRLAIGLAMGAVVAGIMLVAYFGWLRPAGDFAKTVPAVKEKLREFHINTPAKLVAMGVFYALLHSLLEEYYWRWFAFGQLRRLVPLSAAIAVSSVAFMGHHVIVLAHYLTWPWAALASASVAVGGAMWAWLYNRTGSLYAPWLSHLLIDAALFTIAFDMVIGAK